MWEQIIDLISKNANGIIVAIAGVVVGALLTKFAPWLFQQMQRAGAGLLALLGGGWQDYRFERKYLIWLIARQRFLGQLPSNVAVATGEQAQLADLEQIYVELSLTSSGIASGDPAPELNERALLGRRKRSGLAQFIPERFRSDEERPQSQIGRAIGQQSRLVIRGDPGSGKTTLMKYLAVTCARARRGDTRQGDRRDLVKQRLGWKERPFPILISLGRHGKVTTWEKGRTLLDACAEEFGPELEQCPPGFFERRLKQGHCLILLDAFDELGSRDARTQMAQHISGLLDRFPKAQNRTVVTTRIVGYEGQLDVRGFAVQTVQPLSDRDINALVRQRYRVIALNESQGQSAPEVEIAKRRTGQKADQLLGELRRNSRLHSLAVNPLLLSLIVLDHSVKLVLPDERHILYRDCIEILAARWREQRRAELGMTSSADQDLTLSNKISLLQTIALTMQQQRTRSDAGQIPIRRAQVESIIAAQLPNFLTTQLPNEPAARQASCQQKAAAWLDGIKAESGILVELGLDEAGEPVISFSHLTFQEYLAAHALREQSDLPPLLMNNLLTPAWEEVLLLYIGMTQEATPIVQRLATLASAQMGAWLVAGRCLTERAKIGEVERQAVIRGLHALARAGDEDQRARVCELLSTIGAAESKPVLVNALESDAVWKVRHAAGQALGRLGDPRFESVAPEMVTVLEGEFIMGSDTGGSSDEKPQHRVMLKEYRMGKYPVTNQEYKQFIDETGYDVPFADRDWAEPYNWDMQKQAYPEGRANHPVVLVSWRDAQAYCKWLSQKTAKTYRLPTEAEWEKAARGVDAREYPWDSGFDKSRCNTNESGIGATTPVGIYLDGASPCGAMDMAGNVWEWCSSQYRDYPYQSEDGREELRPTNKVSRGFWEHLFRRESSDESNFPRALRGGAWLSNLVGARCAYRNRFDPGYRGSDIGFRVVES